MKEMFIEICILFHSMFFIEYYYPSTIDDNAIDELQLNVNLWLSKWRKLNLPMIMIKDHGIEDHLLRQVKILMELDVL